MVNHIAVDSWKKQLAEYSSLTLSPDHPRAKQINHIWSCLTAHDIVRTSWVTGWKIMIVDQRKFTTTEQMSHGYAMEGRKVVVTTDFINLCNDDKHAIAFTLAHEIAHSLANHVTEQKLRSGLFYCLSMAPSVAAGMALGLPLEVSLLVGALLSELAEKYFDPWISWRLKVTRPISWPLG